MRGRRLSLLYEHCQQVTSVGAIDPVVEVLVRRTRGAAAATARRLSSSTRLLYISSSSRITAPARLVAYDSEQQTQLKDLGETLNRKRRYAATPVWRRHDQFPISQLETASRTGAIERLRSLHPGCLQALPWLAPSDLNAPRGIATANSAFVN